MEPGDAVASLLQAKVAQLEALLSAIAEVAWTDSGYDPGLHRIRELTAPVWFAQRYGTIAQRYGLPMEDMTLLSATATNLEPDADSDMTEDYNPTTPPLRGHSIDSNGFTPTPVSPPSSETE
jgi:hypothetical protein